MLNLANKRTLLIRLAVLTADYISDARIYKHKIKVQ